MKNYVGFDENKLDIKNEQFEFMKKDKNKDKPKWYDIIEEKKERERQLTKIKPCKLTKVENFKIQEPINPEIFFKKYNKKIVRSTFHLTKNKKI